MSVGTWQRCREVASLSERVELDTFKNTGIHERKLNLLRNLELYNFKPLASHKLAFRIAIRVADVGQIRQPESLDVQAEFLGNF